MRITKIDESAYLPDEAIHRLQELGEFVNYTDRPDEEEAVRRLNNTDIAIVEWTPITRGMLERVAGLKYIVVFLTGYEFVDVEAAREHGIPVSNIPAYSRQSVAEHVFALLLALNRQIKKADQAAREGKRDYFEPFMSTELYGKTLGVIGLGSIGSWVARIAQGFGMDVVGHSRTPKGLPNVKDVTLDELLATSDVVVVSVDHNKSTDGMLSRDKLELMKPSAFLVSISPPGIVDERTLAEMLEAGDLAGVGLDIPEEHSPLEKSKRTVLSPGTAWYTQDALDRLARIMVDNVEHYIHGEPQNVVNQG